MANQNAINPAEGAAKFTEDFQEGDGVQRQSTLKKKISIKRTGSKKSLSGSATGEAESRNSVFYTPIPTQGNPTELLANRFNGKLKYSTHIKTKPDANIRLKHGERC